MKLLKYFSKSFSTHTHIHTHTHTHTLSIYLSIYLSVIYLSIRLHIYIHIYIYVYIYIYLLLNLVHYLIRYKKVILQKGFTYYEICNYYNILPSKHTLYIWIDRLIFTHMTINLNICYISFVNKFRLHFCLFSLPIIYGV